MGLYLARWGFTPQKPMKKAYEQSPAAVKKWLDEEYPVIAANAKGEGAEIHWGDETGLRSDDVRGRSDAPQGQTPVIRVDNKRHGLSVISTVTNKGQMRWKAFDGALNSDILIDFMRRLVKDAGRKIYLILDPLKRGLGRISRSSRPLVLLASHAYRQCNADPLLRHCTVGGDVVQHDGRRIRIGNDHLRNLHREQRQQQRCGQEARNRRKWRGKRIDRDAQTIYAQARLIHHGPGAKESPVQARALKALEVHAMRPVGVSYLGQVYTTPAVYIQVQERCACHEPRYWA